MYIENAYAQREGLTDRDLERLLIALREAVEQYRYTIRNYPPDRMEKHGKPFLAKLEERVAVVQRLVENRGVRS